MERSIALGKDYVVTGQCMHEFVQECMYIHKEKNIFLKNSNIFSMFFVYTMQSFQPNLISLSKNFGKMLEKHFTAMKKFLYLST